MLWIKFGNQSASGNKVFQLRFQQVQRILAMKNHFWVLAICGFALRMLAFFSGLSDSFIVERPEITGGMLNEKLSVLEALAMDDKDSTNFTINSPIFLILYGWAFSLSAPIILQLLMASVDIVSAWMMDQIAKELNSDQNWIVWIIIFNPIAIITCVSAGTITLTFVWVLIALRFALKGKELLAAISISLASHLDISFALLIVPLSLFNSGLRAKFRFWSVLILSWLSLLFLSRWSFGSWAFVYKCWPVRISDLTPNLGIYWYLLTNMFEPFRPLFEISFQLIPLFLLIPLTIRFLNTPSFVWYCMLELAVFFKPYPAAVEVLFCLAFFSLHWPLVRPKFRKIGPVIFAISLVSGFSSMVMWYLWINRGSGNANFLYFQFLALNVVRMLVLLESVTSVRLQLSDA